MSFKSDRRAVGRRIVPGVRAVGAAAVFLVLPALTTPGTPAADRMLVPGGTEALARLVGHVDPDPERFAASLNRVLLRRILDDHDLWQQVPDRRLLSVYLSTVGELGRIFPARTELTLEEDRLPQAYLDLAAFFGFEFRGGEWIEGRGSGDAEAGEQLQSVAGALGLDVRFIGYRLQRGESVVVEIPTSTVLAPMGFAEWSALSGNAVDAGNALSRMVEDQRFGLVLEGLRRADRGLAGLLGADGLRTVYTECSLPFYRYASSLQLRAGGLVPPGGETAAPLWRKLVDVPPEDGKRFLVALLREADARAAHLWHAMYFADPHTSRFLLDDSRRSAGLRGPLLDYVDRVVSAEGAGLLPSGRGGDHSLTTLLRSLPLGGPDEADRIAARADPWIETRGLQQPCVEEQRLRKIVRKMIGGKLDADRFLGHLLGDQTPLHGRLGLLFQPFIEIEQLFAPRPELLTPANVVLLRRAAAYRPLLLRTLLHLPFQEPDELTDYLLTGESLDCLAPGPERDSLVLTFQGGVELLAELAREEQLPEAAVSRGLAAWCEIYRDASRAPSLSVPQLRWLRATLSGLPDPAGHAPGRGPGEQRMLAALAGGFETQSFLAHGLRYGGSRFHDLAAGMAAFLGSQSIAPVDLLAELAGYLQELERNVTAPADMQLRLMVFRLLALIEPLEVPPEASIAGLEHPQFAAAVRHRIELREFIETAWRNQPSVPPARIVETIDRVRRLLSRELQGLLCSVAYLRTIALVDDPRFDQPLMVLRHAVDRAVDPQGAALEMFPSAWNETALVPAAFAPAGAHVAGSLTHVSRALVRHHVLRLAPDRTAHTWIDVRPWLNTAIESDWPGLPRDALRLVATAVDTGDALIGAAFENRETLPPDLTAAVDRIVPRRRFEDAIAERAPRPLVAPSERLLAGLLLLDRDAAPAGLEGARRRLAEAASRVGPDWRVALQPLGIPTPRLSGEPRPWVGNWPAYESLEREASVPALRERQFVDVWIAVIRHAVARDLPAFVGFDLLLRVLERIPEDLWLESERDWESLVRFVNALDGPYIDGRLRECLIRGLYSARQL